MSSRPRIGSLFTGYGGLDLAVEAALDADTTWVSDVDPGACRILAARYPDAPNLGDITAVNWADVEPVDILTGGFPCQDVSHAGARAGMGPGTRSGLWSRMADAIDHLRPRLVVIENVRGLLSAEAASDVEPCPWCLGDGTGEPPLRALGSVLADLAELGYDASWYGLRAADVGAPHGRFRVFVLAWPAGGTGATRYAPHLVGERGGAVRGERAGHPGSAGGAGRPAAADPGGVRRSAGGTAGPAEAAGGWARSQPARRRLDTPADTDGARGEGPGGGLPAGGSEPDGCTPADATRDGRDEGRPEPARLVGGPDAAVSGDAAPTADQRCPTCGDLVGYHDEGGFCAGLCGGTCTDPEWGRPGGVDDGEPLPPAFGEPEAAADTRSERRDWRSGVERVGRETPERIEAGRHPGVSAVAWGDYEPAIRRWEHRLGRPAPAPTEPGSKGQPRLSPAFVEFMMGLPAGWVTDVPGLSRNDQLKALGNGVVPQQAAAAVRFILARLDEERRWSARETA